MDYKTYAARGVKYYTGLFFDIIHFVIHFSHQRRTVANLAKITYKLLQSVYPEIYTPWFIIVFSKNKNLNDTLVSTQSQWAMDLRHNEHSDWDVPGGWVGEVGGVLAAAYSPKYNNVAVMRIILQRWSMRHRMFLSIVQPIMTDIVVGIIYWIICLQVCNYSVVMGIMFRVLLFGLQLRWPHVCISLVQLC